jgi:RNA polymerase sigma-70 factor, ECF subfamily
VASNGDPILLMDQDRARWDRLLIHRGLAALARGEALGETSGPYLLQAAIAACHARAPAPADTDWNLITNLYEKLSQLTASPVVELNRAVAVAMASGAEAALEIVDRLDAQGSLRSYHLLPSVRADLLQKLGRFSEAQIEFERAAALTRNERERRLLSDRANACKQGRF